MRKSDVVLGGEYAFLRDYEDHPWGYDPDLGRLVVTDLKTSPRKGKPTVQVKILRQHGRDYGSRFKKGDVRVMNCDRLTCPWQEHESRAQVSKAAQKLLSSPGVQAVSGPWRRRMEPNGWQAGEDYVEVTLRIAGGQDHPLLKAAGARVQLLRATTLPLALEQAIAALATLDAHRCDGVYAVQNQNCDCGWTINAEWNGLSDAQEVNAGLAALGALPSVSLCLQLHIPALEVLSPSQGPTGIEALLAKR